MVLADKETDRLQQEIQERQRNLDKLYYDLDDAQDQYYESKLKLDGEK